jgi:CubicO group peptidase (beta-lactamase class C family)
MKTIIVLFAILILSSTNLFSQRERLERLSQEEKVLNVFSKPAIMDSTELDSIIINTMETYHIPGLAALINTKENGIIWSRNYGYANIALNQLVEDSTLFMIASISKTIVATAIMQFWEADSFDLDDNINDYLDNFQVSNPYHPNDTITFRMLMMHTSGIKDNYPVFNALVVCGDSPITLDSLLVNYFTPGGIYYSAANFNTWAPGSWWDYSSAAVCILAYVVEKFAGTSFEQYCRDNIFDPLDMGSTTTSYFLAGLDTTIIATPYLWSGNQYIPYCHYSHPLYPAVSLRTNKFYLEHFLSAYMNWGQYNGETILDSSTIDLILTDHLGHPDPVYGDTQGLVWFQTSSANNRWPWGHDGAWNGVRSKMFFLQDENWGVMYFINSYPSFAVSNYLLNLLCDHAQGILVGVEEISNVLTDFYLEQNYPNPFNNSTVIKYSIPQEGLVTLKVYNLLGEEVARLVNDTKQTGNYEVSFDATGLPSGIYFYRLRTGDFVETKKMVLTK